MPLKLLIACFILFILQGGVCGSGRNITHEVTDIQGLNSSSDYFSNANFTLLFDGQDYQAGLLALAYLVPTVAVLGLCGNVVVLVVWSAEKAFNPTTFLMKCLAATDVILLLLLLYTFIHASFTSVSSQLHWTVFVLLVVLYYFRTVTAHTTLGVVVTRWVAVHKPLRVHSLLTKRRVVGGYVLMLVWCLIPFIVMSIAIMGIISTYRVSYLSVTEGVYLALPILMLVVLNVSLLCTLFSNRHNSSLGQQQQQHAARAARSSQLKYLLGAVLCLSITTVLAYPAGVAYRSVMLLNLGYFIQVCPRFCFLFMPSLSTLLEVFNSSINVVYYLVFISRFRQLCRLRCWSCWRCCRCKRSSEYVTDRVTVTQKAIQTDVVECSHLSTH